MTGTAAPLVDRVIPDVPVRQWVLTVPFSLRLLLGQKAPVLAAVNRILATEIERAYVAATATLAPDAERRGGSVTFVQRFSGSRDRTFHVPLNDDADSTGISSHAGLRTR